MLPRFYSYFEAIEKEMRLLVEETQNSIQSSLDALRMEAISKLGDVCKQVFCEKCDVIELNDDANCLNIFPKQKAICSEPTV